MRGESRSRKRLTAHAPFGGLLGENFEVFYMFFLRRHFSFKNMVFRGSHSLSSGLGVAAVEVAFRSIPVWSESAKNDPEEAKKTMQGNYKKSGFCFEAGTL